MKFDPKNKFACKRIKQDKHTQELWTPPPWLSLAYLSNLEKPRDIMNAIDFHLIGDTRRIVYDILHLVRADNYAPIVRPTGNDSPICFRSRQPMNFDRLSFIEEIDLGESHLQGSTSRLVVVKPTLPYCDVKVRLEQIYDSLM